MCMTISGSGLTQSQRNTAEDCLGSLQTQDFLIIQYEAVEVTVAPYSATLANPKYFFFIQMGLTARTDFTRTFYNQSAPHRMG